MFEKIEYKNDVLYYDNVSILDIAKQYDTPIYIYSKSQIVENYNAYKTAFEKNNIANFQISYAVKANDNLTILKILKQLGSGVDVVSVGEIKKALLAGFEPSKIVFSGVGKTEEELIFAIKNNIGQINVESYEEFEMICKIAIEYNISANISVRINPNIDAHTHSKITTGKKDNKFGVSIEVGEKIFSEVKSNEEIKKYIHFNGFSVHIGSQILDIAVFEKLFVFMQKLYQKYNNNFSTIDFGGGIGIQYSKDDNTIDIDEYVEMIKKYFPDFKGKIIVEPGRSIIGNAGIFLSKIVRIKKTENTNFIVLDGGMNNLIRPAMYDACHYPMVVKKTKNQPKTYDVVGQICESSDVFCKNIDLNEVKEGDNYIAFLCAGAYGRSMASNYNSHNIAGELLIDNGKIKEIRKPISTEDLWKFEKF